MAALSDNIMSYISANVVGRAGKVLRRSRNMGPLYLGVWHWHREGLEEQPLVTLRLFTVVGIICFIILSRLRGQGHRRVTPLTWPDQVLLLAGVWPHLRLLQEKKGILFSPELEIPQRSFANTNILFIWGV